MIRFKRGLAIVLSICMIGGMMPLPVSAEETVSENIVQTECIENTENLENAPSEDEKSSETDHETGSETESETVTDAETDGTAISAIQALIDALPDADSITEDNVENVTSQLDTIDEAKAELSDADMSQLDLTRYDAAINKVMVLMGMKEENDSEIAAQTNDSAGKTEQQSTDEAIVYQPAVETTDKYDIDDDGEKETVYEISNAGQLYWFAGLVNGTLDGVEQNTLANAILTANITVNENLLDSLQYDTEGNVSNGSDFITWTPIADWMGNRTTQYSGTFDGNNKTVSGLYFNGDSTCIGLFGSSESDGNIKNVGVVDSYFKGNDHVGGVCGNNAGTITNCYNAGNLTAIESSATVGGICGYNNGGTVTNCYNTGTVTATGSVASVGGVCGCSTELILNCYNIGTVTATSSSADISGICGYNFGPIKNCYYLADTEDENGGKTAAQFASGEIAYLLSQGCTVGEGEDAVTYSGSVWGQALGGNGDTYPVLDSTKRVYQVDKYDGCEGKPGSSTKVYSNQSTSIYEEHKYEADTTDSTKHKCSICNGTEEHNYTYKVADGITDTIQAVCDVCNDSYTVKLTAPTGTDGKLTYTGIGLAASTEITKGVLGETLPDVEYATVRDDTVSAYSTDVPVNAGNYRARLTLGSGNNVVSATVDYTIAKAQNAPNMPGTTIAPVHSTEKVGDITLPDGWNWSDTDKDKELADGVAMTAIAVYIGADKGNYENVSVTITITCSSCDHTNTEVRDKKEVTCTEDGYSGDVYCKDCNALVTQGSVIVHPGHKLKKVAAKAATATAAGNKAYYVCENEGCGRYFEDDAAQTEITDKSSVVIPATGGGSTSGGGSSSGGGTSSEGGSSSGGGSTSGGGSSSGATDKPGTIDKPGTTDQPGTTDKPDATDKPGTSTQPAVPSKGTKIVDKAGTTYKVTSTGSKNKAVQYTAAKKSTKTVTVPSAVKIDGVSYKVTSIAASAFRNNKKLTRVVIGNNIVSIGKNAFKGCENVKTIKIKSTHLTSGSIAEDAFADIPEDATIKVPKSKYKAYLKLLRKKGLSRKVKIVKY